MNVNIHNALKTEYENRRKAAYDNLVARTQEVYSKLPEIEEIDNKIKLSGLRYNKMILLGSGDYNKLTGELALEISALKKHKQLLLSQSGYPEDYLEIVYICPICEDTGYTKDSNGLEVCPCYKQQVINLSFSQSNLKLTEIENFSSFNESYYTDIANEKKYGSGISPRENILRIKERSLKFINNFILPDEKNLFFSGPAGIGKTFMSNCIAVVLLNKGNTVLYQTAPKLFDTINEYKFKAFKDDDFQDMGYKNIFNVDLLIIDDLGTEPQSAARYAELLTILNTRQLNNLSKPCKTIISTNLEVKELYERYTERVASRIIGCFDMFKFTGEDIRMLKKLSDK